MLLKYLYRPKWYFDEVDMRFVLIDYKKVLHYSNDDGETWEPVPCEEFPSLEEQKRLQGEFPPNPPELMMKEQEDEGIQDS